MDREVERKMAEALRRPLAVQLAEAIKDADIMQAGCDRALVLLRERRDADDGRAALPGDWRSRVDAMLGPVAR